MRYKLFYLCSLIVCIPLLTNAAIVLNDTSSNTTHDVGSGSDRALICGLRTTGGDTVSAVDFNGDALTQITKIERVDNADRWIYLYSLINPDSGSHTITVTGDYASIHCASYTGIKQTGNPTQSGQDTQNAAGLSKSLTSTEDNSLLIAYFINHNEFYTTAAGSSYVANPLIRKTDLITPAGSASVGIVSTGGADNFGVVAGVYSPSISSGGGSNPVSYSSTTVASTTLQLVGATTMGFSILIVIVFLCLIIYVWNSMFKRKSWLNS